MKLHELAHARTGDKGDISDISVIAYHPADFDFLREYVTAERVREHFADIVRGRVDRYEVPQLSALKFVLHSALGGGVTRTLNLDIHGKSLSCSLLEMQVPEQAAVAS
ncbi:hypothetical protein [Nocardia sp. NPDC127526]|uniref:AtuA-related protein n=1 Tax=Nocardia sp. NPDC127526 TaxID=3345393 RepID=UPI00363F943C